MEDDEGSHANLCNGLVREYLFRKGYTDVLAKFDVEIGDASTTAVNSTLELVKSLKLVKIYKANANNGAPLSTTLELLTHYFLNSNADKGQSAPSEAITVAALPARPDAHAHSAAHSPPAVQARTKDSTGSVDRPDAASGSGNLLNQVDSSTSASVGLLQADRTPAEVSTPVSVPAPAAPRPVPAAAPSAPVPGESFWDRINAAKAPASEVVPEPLPSATPHPAPRTSALASVAPAASGSFWERMNAAKSAATAEVAAVPAKFAFTAPDGKGFNDRNEYRKYVFDTFYTFSSKSNQQLRKIPGEITGQPFNLVDLDDCVVELCDHADMIQVDRLKRCKVLIGACCESVFLRNCVDCTFTIACKQLRTRDCVNCRINLYSKTDPIIEKSHGMTFYPFNAAYPNLDLHFKAANLPPEVNHWKKLFDFSKDDASMPQPHWQVIDEQQEAWLVERFDVTGDIAPVNPAALVLPVVQADADSSLHSFDIRTTSQAQAEALLRNPVAPVVFPAPQPAVEVSHSHVLAAQVDDCTQAAEATTAIVDDLSSSTLHAVSNGEQTENHAVTQAQAYTNVEVNEADSRSGVDPPPDQLSEQLPEQSHELSSAGDSSDVMCDNTEASASSSFLSDGASHTDRAAHFGDASTGDVLLAEDASVAEQVRLAEALLADPAAESIPAVSDSLDVEDFDDRLF